jgi:DNA-binding response OmpR family regulator
VEAAEPRDALDLREQAPDVVVQNLDLTDMQGPRLLRHLRRRAGTGELPVLACSDNPGDVAKARTWPGGFSGFLLRPFLPSYLVQTLRFYLRHRQLPAEIAPEPPAAVSPPAPPHHCVGRKVLIVSDAARQRNHLAEHLGRLGFQANVASDGFDGLTAALCGPPDLVITDTLMPGFDGFELTLAFRRLRHLARTPIVMISAGHISEIDRRLARRLGVIRLLEHPLDGAAVAEAAQACVSTVASPSAILTGAMQPIC